MWNLGYHLARAQGDAVRKFYRSRLPQIVRRTITPPRALELEVFAYSNEQNLPEQIASFRSFLRYAGRPSAFHVVSDGSHTAASIALLQAADESVSVISMENFRVDAAPPEMESYLTTHPTGKQLALIMSLPFDRPALYLDSDILFFPGAHRLAEDFAKSDAAVCYLADCQFAGDRRLLDSPAEEKNPVNTGALLFHRRPDWSIAFERFARVAAGPTFFTNQTLTHLALHRNEARPFDAARYVLQLDDQFVYRDYYRGDQIALRHYVQPVRHKLWTALSFS